MASYFDVPFRVGLVVFVCDVLMLLVSVVQYGIARVVEGGRYD